MGCWECVGVVLGMSLVWELAWECGNDAGIKMRTDVDTAGMYGNCVGKM